MSIRYQRAVTDGSLNFTVGTADWSRFWARSADELRFHRGKQFRIDGGPLRKFSELEDRVHNQLSGNVVDTVVRVVSELDGFGLAFRRKDVQTGGDRIVAHAAALLGTPYVFDVTDCSWLTLHCYGEEGIVLPHQSGLQANMFGGSIAGFVRVTRAQVKPGDLLFRPEHVAIYRDDTDQYGTVWDTEPHDTKGPPGWPTTYLGTGVRPRPMWPNYFCGWENITSIGRVVSINGQP